MNKFAEYLKEYTENKSVCVLGFGREGKSTFGMLNKYCSPKSVTIADLNNIDDLYDYLAEGGRDEVAE